MRSQVFVRCAAALLAALAGAAHAGEVHVAVAANFAAALARIGAGFTAATGHTLKVSSGATGKFLSQIRAGAPFDVLLAADDQTPARLVTAGDAVAGTRFTYAFGRLALWSARPGFVDGDGQVLARGGFAHLAIANPKTAPYGAAAIAVLKSRGVLDAAAPKLVTGESVAQAYQFVATGNAELGFVAWSQLNVPGQPARGSHWLVPPALHGEIRQDAVLLKAGATNAAARALLEHLKSPAARVIIESYGYAGAH